MSFHTTPARKTVMANALIKCMILILALTGLLGSFFLNRYMSQN